MVTTRMDETQGEARFEWKQTTEPTPKFKSVSTKPKTVDSFFVNGIQVSAKTFWGAYEQGADTMDSLKDRFEFIVDAHNWRLLEHLQPDSQEFVAISEALDLAGLEEIEAALSPENQAVVARMKAQLDFTGTHMEGKAGRFVQLAGGLGQMFVDYMTEKMTSLDSTRKA